jgi:hypothetical protein
MKKTFKIVPIFNFFVSFAALLFAQQSLAYNPYQVFEKDRIDVSTSVNYFKSESNFNSDGDRQDLTSGNYFQNIEITPTVRWEYIENIGFITGLNIGVAESSDPLLTRKNSIVNRFDLGADYLFSSSDIHETYLRFIYSHALERASLSTDAVSTSDGVNEIKPEIITRFNFSNFYPYIQGGVNYRSDGLSLLMTYAAGFELRFAEIGLGAAALGRFSIQDDEYTNSASIRDNFNNRVNGGSKKYFSINPNSTDVELSATYAANQDLLFKLFAGYTLIGSNSAAGYNAGFSINLSFDDEDNYRRRKIKSRLNRHENVPKVIPKVNPKDFKEDTNDGVNQEYFKPVTPAQLDYIQKVEGAVQEQQTLPKENQQQMRPPTKNPDYSIRLKRVKMKKKKK